MVFESYVVSILNKFLGQYVENLDPSQFQMSIWGGDVKLENLILKENALDDLDLPVKVLRGHLGQLILKIPWKNLYSEPVVAKVEGVYLLARPNTDIKYDAEKEEKIKQEKKQQELTTIEEAIKYAEEAKNKTEEDKEKSMSFAEKLAMHIVKNIQIFVSNIHIRYEDTLSNEDGPFSVGITLENLSAESVDDNWQPVVVDSKQNLVNKLVRLDNLALYLNSHDKIGGLPTPADWVNIAKAGIAKGEFGDARPKNYNYVIEPLTLETKAKLDTNTVPNLSIPKVFVEVIMQELGVVLSRHQFKDIMRLADNFDRMKTNSQFRKYKPFVPLKEDKKAWWNYAIRAVLEEEVKRRSRNWSWKHIVNHRMTCHKYMLLYKEKLSHKSVSDKVQKEITQYEEVLDVLNITIWRKQAEIETKKEGTNYEVNQQRKKSEGGWFSGFFGGKKSKKTSKTVEGLTEEEQKAEEEKLYAAIGYSESDAPVKLPPEYVAYKLKFAQKRISVKLHDDTIEPTCCVSSVSLEDLFMELGYRPGALAVSVLAKLGNLNVLGCPKDNESAPEVINSIAGDTDIAEYVNASFETNPLDGKCDQRIRLTVQPLEVIYHATTIESLMNFFKLPEDVHLSEISAAAYSQIEGLRNQSRTNLSYAIETRTLLDIDILVHSPFVIIPEKGVLSDNCSVLVVDLGSLKVSSDPTQERITNTKSMSPEELEEKVYDRFDIELKQLQILMAKPGENWKECRNEEKSSLHILNPFGLNIQLHKCLAADDVRLAQIRLAGMLSTLQLHVTDKRLDDLIKLALSIPIPGEEDSSNVTENIKPTTILREVKAAPHVSALDVVVEKEMKSATSEDVFATPPESPEDSIPGLVGRQSSEDEEAMKLAKAQQTNVALKFEIVQINVSVSTQDQFGIESPLLEVDLLKLGTQVSVRQYDLTVMANIGDILVKEMIHGIDGAPLELVSTPADLDILAVKFVQANKSHPQFKEAFNSTEKAIDVQFASLKVVLHQEALLNLVEFANNLLPASEDEIQPQQVEELEESPNEEEGKSADDQKTLAKKETQEDEIIEVKVDARLGEFTAVITSVKGDVAELQMKQLEASVSMLSDRITVLARMQDFSVLDGAADATYPKIVTIVNEEVFNVQVVIFNGATEGENYGNMEKVDTKFLMNVGRIRVIFLNRFVSNLLEFVQNFQRAQEAIENASKTAAQSASQSIQEYNKNSPRVKLDVSIQAPLVIIPVNSQSERALVADLGNLEVHNNFNVVQGGVGPNIAVVDNMAVSFTSLQLSVAIISKDETIVAQRLILKPISLELTLARSLSSWYHDIPDIDVSGQLHAVNIGIGTDDLKTALAITSQNLTEGATIASDADDETYASSESSLAVVDTPDEEVSEVVAEEEKTWIAVKFQFGIETIAAKIYKDISQLDANDRTTWEHPADKCLGQFSLDHFSLVGSMLANGAMETSVVLQTISVVDERPALEKAITTMIERREDERTTEQDTSNMIAVQFKQTKELDKNIVVLVKGMSIIVNVEFLVVLSTVFTEALEEASTKESETVTEVLADARMVSSDLASSSTAQPTAANQNPELQVTLQIEEPEIFLLADAKQKNTNALIIKNALDVSLKIRDEQIWFQTAIQNLHIVTASFAKSRREISQADVLRMKHVSLRFSSIIGGRPHIDLNTYVAYLNISPAFVGIATAVATSLAPSKDEDDKENNEDVPDLFKAVDIAHSTKWYLKEVGRGQLVPGSRIFARAPDLKSYAPGLITVIDKKIEVILDDGAIWSCDVNDVRGVVLDETPLAKEIAVGTHIIALLKEGDPMQRGVVTKIIESSNTDGPNVLVRFSSGQEEAKPLEYIRVLRSVKQGAAHNRPVVSCAVWARLPDKEHYGQGFIAKKDWRYKVKFANGTHIYHFVNDPLSLVLDRVPRPERVTVGSDVIAPIPNKPLMYPGRVKKIMVNAYEIQFDNGAVHEVSIYDLKMMKLPREKDHRLSVRTLLWIKYSDNFYYRGYIDGIDNKIYVRFYEHDERCSFPLNDRSGLVRDVTPKEVMVGETVVVLKGTYGMEGVVTNADFRETDPVFLIEGAGNEMWVPLKDIRRLERTTGGKGMTHDHELENITDDREERLMMNVEGFVFNVEAEKGGNLISLLNMRGNLLAEVKNWQDKLNGKAELHLEANYFNEELSEWEPLIEKLETTKGLRPWELFVGFKMNQEDTLDDSGSQMVVSVESKDVLELTITKTNIDVFSELGKSFSEAVTESIGGFSVALEKTAPYEIKNELGVDVFVKPGKTFKAPEDIKDGAVLVRSGESLLLNFAHHLRLTSTSSDIESIKIAVQVDGYHEVKDISVKEASCGFFNIVPKKLHKQGFRSMVVQVTSPDGRKLVVLRSPFRMKNNCPVPLELFVQNQSVELLGTLKQDDYFNIPLSMANDDLGYFIKPGGFPYDTNVEEIRLSQVSKNGRKLFACAAPWDDADPFYVQARCVSERYSSVAGSKSNQPCYTLHYYPPVVLMNYLPFPVQFSQEGVGTPVNLDGGNKLPIYTVDLDNNPSLHIKLESYLGETYTGQIRLRSDLAQLSVLYLVSGSKKLVVGVYVKKSGSLEITLYSTYWLINHTGLPLDYKASDSDAIIQHPANENEVAIFAFTSKPEMFSKNTLRLRTSGSDWSDKFSLDTAGSGGSLKCKKNGKEYGIGSEIRLSYFSLTKIVVFTPLNLLVNQTKHAISLCEAQGSWYTVKSSETIPFWPNNTPAKNLKIKIDDSPIESILFDFQSNVNLLLRLDNKVGGVCVTMFSKDAATVMTFTPYFEGSAPLRIDNDSSYEICYRQLNSEKVHVLPPKKTTVFTWDNLQAKREVEWFIVGHEKFSAKSNLEKNGMGTLGAEGEPLCHWASFLDGLQRILYFTENYTMAFRAQQDQLEVPGQEITLSLKGIGLSLVNNKKSVELAYLSITPSHVLWEEQKKRRRWKTMTTKTCEALETVFKSLKEEQARGARAAHRRKVDNMTVDFETMEIIEPDRRPIRRTFHPGVWVQFNQSAHEIQLHSKINDIQMDSQVPGSTFQTLFHSIPPPKTVAASNAPKPMIEASMITRKEENAIVSRIKYFKVLVQELDVKVDKGWLMELVALFGSENQALDETNYEEDRKIITTSLQSLNAAVTDVRNYYDYFHLSPIKVHVSFSVQGGSGKQTNVGGNVVDLLLNSLGVAVADVQDVVLKLAYFELKSQIYSQSQLTQVAIDHYTSQAIKQAYVLVLGLDVLGNPFGLIAGLTTGAKDLFYEPYQGLIQGPEEFAEGLALGVKSLVGHTIGGAAGAVSRITGTLGKGIAALTMDDEYQQSRRTAMSKKPTSVKEGLSRGGKGLLEGVYEGVTGVVTKPMEGAKKSGAKGFFKGVGKGLVGVVAKPVSGVVDFASSTLEGIKGTASGDRVIKRVRPPRRFYADKIMRPYNRYDAEGVELLKIYAQGKETLAKDSYVCHYYFADNMAIMVTNIHVLLMKKETIIKNEWENVWFCNLKDLQADPKVSGTKITFTTPEQGKMFKKTGTKVVDLKSGPIAEWIAKSTIDARSLLR